MKVNINNEILSAIDNIDSVVQESEMNVLTSLCDVYEKTCTIMEHYEGEALSDFDIFQEGFKDVINEAKGSNGENIIKKILLFIPRLLRAIVKAINKVIKNKKYKKIVEDFNQRFKEGRNGFHEKFNYLSTIDYKEMSKLFNSIEYHYERFIDQGSKPEEWFKNFSTDYDVLKIYNENWKNVCKETTYTTPSPIIECLNEVFSLLTTICDSISLFIEITEKHKPEFESRTDTNMAVKVWEEAVRGMKQSSMMFNKILVVLEKELDNLNEYMINM